MKVLLVSIMSFILGFTNQSDSNHGMINKFDLEFIYHKDFAIKIDGGCSFYTYDTTLLSQNKYTMVVSKNQIAFIKIKDKLIYLKFTGRKNRVGGYTESFREKNFNAVIDINEIQKRDNKEKELIGSLKIFNQNDQSTFLIHGFSNY